MASPAFNAPIDIANFCAVRLGQPRVANFTSTKMGTEAAFVYDKLRQAELERNLWRFATKEVVLRPIGIDTVIWVPTGWVTATSYSAGAVISYIPTSGVYLGETNYWQLTSAKTSSTAPDVDDGYSRYTGPTFIDLYNTGSAGDGTSNTVYQAGEVVLVPATYDVGTTYAKNDVVNSFGWWYVSMVDGNLDNDIEDTTYWTLWTSTGRSSNSYGVTASNSPVPLTYPTGYAIYISLYNENADNPDDATGTWLSVGGGVTPWSPFYPLGSGPSHITSTRNVFRLPRAFLKRAPNDPKGGLNAYLGSASGSFPDDWVLEGSYLISSSAGPIVLRFVADVTDVQEMDGLFCIGLAERMAADLCETITQSDAKVALATRAYKTAISEARASNMIEIGPISPVENRYVTVRG